MTISSPSVKSLVIQAYLNGKSRDQISKETEISTGKTSNIITDWKKVIKIPNVDELREFAVTVKKSGMTMAQCARGYRIVQLMDSLGISDNDYYENEDTEGDYSSTSSTNYGKKIDFLTFVKDIYMNCKQFEINPSNLFSWIKDLFDYRSCLIDDDIKSVSLNSQQNQKNKDQDDYYNNDNIKPVLESNYNNKSDLYPSQLQSKKELNLDDIDKPSSDIYKANNTLSSDFSSRIIKDSLKVDEIKIPFTSQLSFYINQKKKECIGLENHKKNLKQDVKNLENEKSKLVYDLDQITTNKKSILSSINWSYKLKRELWENYSITLEHEIKNFSHLISDFKEHRYDAHQIIKEYLRSLSIKSEIKTLESHIVILSNQRESLNNTVLSLQSQIEIHKQTLDTYHQLEVMGFGLKELKKLWNTVWEIAYSNNISSNEAYLKFFKDLEEEYDNKLGFEIKVQEKKKELYHLKNQLNADRLALQLQPYLGTVLQNLFQNGVSEEDIINMTDVVSKFSQNSSISNSFPFNMQNTNNGAKSDNDYSLNINENNNNRTKIWKSFISNLEKLNDIQLHIKERVENRNKIQKELDYLNNQKQESASYLQIAISFINAINHRISYLKGFIDCFKNDIEKKINKSPGYSRLLPFIILYANIQKEEKDDNNKDKQ